MRCSSLCHSAFFFFFVPLCFVLLLLATMLGSLSTCHSASFFFLLQCFLLASVLSSSCYNDLFFFLLQWFIFTATIISFSSPCYNAFFLLQCYLLATVLCSSLCCSAFIFLLQCFVFLLQYFILLLLATMLCVGDAFLADISLWKLCDEWWSDKSDGLWLE